MAESTIGLRVLNHLIINLFSDAKPKLAVNPS
jgi:hypothetical protein